MSTQIFSTYATDENRVTASTLAVLQSLSLQRFQRLLGQLIEQPDRDLITIQNQVSRGEAGVPDAVISASFRTGGIVGGTPGDVRERRAARERF